MGNKSSSSGGAGGDGASGGEENKDAGGGSSNNNNNSNNNNTSTERAELMQAALAGRDGGQKVGFWAGLKQGYAELCNAIIRPPRAEYTTRELGPQEFTFRGRKFIREDFNVTNTRGQRLVCSHWKPHDSARPAERLPCVVYLHGNSSCRFGALEALEVVLLEGATCVGFDFAGSGQSDGDWVTLGWNEKDDLLAVVEHLRTSGQVSSVALWGRSMGAATALLHGHRDPSIAALVLDSSFADLQQLADEMVAMGKADAGLRVPGFVVKAATKLVRSSVLKKSGLDMYKLKPVANVDKCFIPALFIAGESDEFIPPRHSQQIHDKYAGDKNMVLVPGGHNSERPKFCLDSIAIFLRTSMLLNPAHALPPGPTLFRTWGNGGGRGFSTARFTDLEEEMIRRAMAASLSMTGGGGGGSTRSAGTAPGHHGEVTGTAIGFPDWGMASTMEVDGAGAGPTAAAAAPRPPWECSACTYRNAAGRVVCEMCSTPAPAPAATPAAASASSAALGAGAGADESLPEPEAVRSAAPAAGAVRRSPTVAARTGAGASGEVSRAAAGASNDDAHGSGAATAAPAPRTTPAPALLAALPSPSSAAAAASAASGASGSGTAASGNGGPGAAYASMGAIDIDVHVDDAAGAGASGGGAPTAASSVGGEPLAAQDAAASGGGVGVGSDASAART